MDGVALAGALHQEPGRGAAAGRAPPGRLRRHGQPLGGGADPPHPDPVPRPGRLLGAGRRGRRVRPLPARAALGDPAPRPAAGRAPGRDLRPGRLRALPRVPGAGDLRLVVDRPGPDLVGAGEHGRPGDRAGPHHRAAGRAPLHGLAHPARETQKHAEYIWRSADGGKTWGRRVAVAKDAVHMYCEGAYIPLAGGALVCVLRDNLHHNYPSQVALSFDNGETWTGPVEAPFAGGPPVHRAAGGRAYPGHLPQPGRQPGHLRLAGRRWTSSSSTGYRVSALHLGPEEISLSARGGPPHHPPPAGDDAVQPAPPGELPFSEVLFDAQVRVESLEWRPGRALRPGAAGARQRAPHARAERALPERLRIPSPA